MSACLASAVQDTAWIFLLSWSLFSLWLFLLFQFLLPPGTLMRCKMALLDLFSMLWLFPPIFYVLIFKNWLIAYFQGSLYAFKWHDFLLNLAHEYFFKSFFCFLHGLRCFRSSSYVRSAWGISSMLPISHKCLVIFVVDSHDKCINAS